MKTGKLNRFVLALISVGLLQGIAACTTADSNASRGSGGQPGIAATPRPTESPSSMH